MPMKCLFWNIRGLNSKTKQLDLKEFLGTHRAPLITLIETKVEARNMDSIATNICRDYQYIVNYSSNPMGRVCILWDNLTLQVDPQIQSDQFIHSCITVLHSGLQFYMTSVYAHNGESARTQLWEDLVSVARNSMDKPWLIGGDMNEVRYTNEKIGGRPPSLRRLKKFNRCIGACNVQDLKAVGHTRSWTNLQQVRITSRLDRTLINSRWLTTFPESFTDYLEPGLSDHSALMVHFSPEVISGHKPFKCFNIWYAHPSFMDVVEFTWQTEVVGTPQYRLAKKLQLVKSALKRWNREDFGNVHQKLKHNRDHLAVIQRLLHDNPMDPTMISQEKEARLNYANLLVEEESFIRQKSRQNSIQLGDSNSAYFYASMAARKARNTLRKVRLQSGEFSDDPKIVMAESIGYYKKLLNNENRVPIPPIAFSNSLSCSDNVALSSPVTEKEIWKALQGMKSSSSPGPDGFPASFYKKCWKIVKEEVILAVQSFFRDGKLLKQLNTTFISLIPKSQNADSLEQYRPISLCNTIYKLITKIMATRIQDVLPSLISSNQSAFIKGRKVSHNILLAHELITILHRQQNRGRACIKMDLSKAFDSIRWPFLLQALKGMGFNQHWINLIMQCIGTPRFSHGRLNLPYQLGGVSRLAWSLYHQWSKCQPLMFCRRLNGVHRLQILLGPVSQATVYTLCCLVRSMSQYRQKSTIHRRNGEP
ncbi:hypothetical protein QJS10_CPA01g01582 [Acorus calamus]|uniref:Reverse transcriptase domain-containing protein n=1 Tax=Acorus calamus TaxID=4465 RepID=A0AAV9ELZ1_ACOCL|nr:hypothetical protein QJS10_CPA06g01721 [Acorus calamus]KAK1325787.1 hypothetical protein QJS10_CPA01g01582 [Acorus calamus]